MPDPLPLPVRTERLLLRAATVGDVESTWVFRRLPEVAEWVTELPPDLDAYRATFTDPDRLATTLVVEHDGEVVGDLMLRREDAWAQKEVAADARLSQAELGWVLDPRSTGRGFATEAVRELLRLCFEDLGVRRVVAYCFADNEPSWRLMERLGMRRETHAVEESLHRSRGWLDSYGYALLAREWSASA
jgi:RimJ/RimL family protein N-acetyltransferase